MKLTIEPTSQFATIDGATCRVWIGTDESGTPVKAWVQVVQPLTVDEARLATFDAELRALPAPRTAVAVDMRFVVD